MDYKKITDYSIIGDLLTCALVGKDGSIDWYCLPHMDSPSVFAAILDKDNGGNFSIAPAGKFSSKQQYVKNTNVLQTHFKCRGGYVTVTDFMPVKHMGRLYESSFPTLIRQIKCTKGKVNIDLDFRPRFNYGRDETRFEQEEDVSCAMNSNGTLTIQTKIPLTVEGDALRGSYKLKQHETVWVTLQYNDDRRLSNEHCQNSLETTIAFWRSWVNDSDVFQDTGLFKSPWKEMIIRSGLVLKLLIQDLTGAVCAAATTSLPEEIGGVRNWDYRFNWIRDASFTVRALYKLGYIQEAKKNLEWFMGIAAQHKRPHQIQVMYGLGGESDLKEEVLDNLSGYKDSKPVRIGNGAVKQKQHDIYGELINAFYETRRFGIDISENEWELICRTVQHVCRIWRGRDAGIWEVRGKDQHFVHSKLMCWVALDRAIRIAKKMHKDVPSSWLETRKKIRKEILAKGFNKKLNSFVQAFGSDTLDASALLIPIVRFLPYDDPRVQSTVNAILKKLTTKSGLVYRYDTKKTDDGLPGNEGAFLICSFWLIDVLAYSGRTEEAKHLLLNILEYASPTGLFSEEVDPRTGEALGNYPQAYSHIGMINSILFVEKARKKKMKMPPSVQAKKIAIKLKNMLREKRAARKRRERD